MTLTDYGTDTSCTDEYRPGRMVKGTMVVLEHAYRRLTTRRGSCPGAPDDGIDVRDYLHSAHDKRTLPGIASAIRSEMMKDDRIAWLSVAATYAPNTLTITIRGTTSNKGQFHLVLGVDELNVTILDKGVR